MNGSKVTMFIGHVNFRWSVVVVALLLLQRFTQFESKIKIKLCKMKTIFLYEKHYILDTFASVTVRLGILKSSIEKIVQSFWNHCSVEIL